MLMHYLVKKAEGIFKAGKGLKKKVIKAKYRVCWYRMMINLTFLGKVLLRSKNIKTTISFTIRSVGGRNVKHLSNNTPSRFKKHEHLEHVEVFLLSLFLTS